MQGVFESDGVTFHYPLSWKLLREETENGWTVSVQSPQTAFFLLTLDTDAPEPQLVVETALNALTEDYPELEADEAIETLGGQPAVGHNLRFFSFDLTNSCWTRSFYTAAGTLLAMWQTNDLELEEVEPIFRAICQSLKVETE